MLVSDRENRLLESAAFDLGEEGRKLFFRCQRRSPGCFLVRASRGKPDVNKSN